MPREFVYWISSVIQCFTRGSRYVSRNSSLKLVRFSRFRLFQLVITCSSREVQKQTNATYTAQVLSTSLYACTQCIKAIFAARGRPNNIDSSHRSISHDSPIQAQQKSNRIAIPWRIVLDRPFNRIHIFPSSYARELHPMLTSAYGDTRVHRRVEKRP